jgi:beta-N-acetylhexosaminidase
MKKILYYIITLFIIVSFVSCEHGVSDPVDDLDFKIGQMLMVGFNGFEANGINNIAEDIERFHAGGIVLYDYNVPTQKFERNIQSPLQLYRLTNSLKKYSSLPLLIAIDQEGGRVNRLKVNYGFPASVSAGYLGTLNNLDSTNKYAETTALTLQNEGININLAPVVDLNINPENPVIGKIGRSFSADPAIVVSHASEVIKAHHRHNIFTTLKHFPGHGSSTADSHLGLTDVTATWQRSELEPYRAIINAGICDIVMTAHIFNSNLDAEYPATLSKNIITGILRDELKFDGVVISDDMQMKAISDYYGLETAIYRAINAGVDILLFANNSVYDADILKKAVQIIKKLLNEGKITPDRINQSFKRISKLKYKLNTGN